MSLGGNKWTWLEGVGEEDIGWGGHETFLCSPLTDSVKDSSLEKDKKIHKEKM